MTTRPKLIFAALLLFLLPTPALADGGKTKPARRDWTKIHEAHVYKADDGRTMPYRLFVPDGVEAAKDGEAAQRYPLVLFLHGAGCRGDDNRKNIPPPVFALPHTQKKHPAFVVAPQCPKGKKWVDTDWRAASHTIAKKPSEPFELADAILHHVIAEYPIDTSRIYVVGQSMGGFGTWEFLARYPGLFAAAAPICGGADLATAERIAHVPVWVFHGEKDNVVKVTRSREMVKALEEAGGEPTYTEYPDVKHPSWRKAYREPGLIEWLFSKTKAKDVDHKP